MNIYKRFRRTISLVLPVIILMKPVYAGGGGLGGGATEFTQLANNVELVDIALKDAENLVYTIKQYEIMYENIRNLPNHIKQQALADLKRLADVVKTGRAIAYSSGQIDEDYRNRFKDYDYYREHDFRNADGTVNHEALSDQYQDWSETNHDSIRGALRAAGLQAQQFDREDSALKTIENQIETAAGEKQLLQAGASIAALQVEQMQKLRQLVMAQVQLQSVQAGSETDQKAQDNADFLKHIAPIGKGDPNFVNENDINFRNGFHR